MSRPLPRPATVGEQTHAPARERAGDVDLGLTRASLSARPQRGAAVDRIEVDGGTADDEGVLS